jgi:hypothetical protein
MRKLNSVDTTWKDSLLWPVIKIIWESFSLKRVHWWHWHEYKGDLGGFVSVEGDKSARSRHKSFKDNLLLTNFLWTKCAVVRPKDYDGLYRRGFRATEGGVVKTELCDVLLSGTHAGLIVGPSDTDFFAVSYPDNIPLDMELLYVTSKYDLAKDIPLT